MVDGAGTSSQHEKEVTAGGGELYDWDMETYLPWTAPVLTTLWALICLRIYTMISIENAGQRRLIAMGGAVGAALIYILASNVVTLLQTPAEEVPAQENGRVKVQMKG